MSFHNSQGGNKMTKRSKMFSLLSIALVFALVVAGCGGNKAPKPGDTASDVIKVGIFEPLTGDNAAGF